MVIEDVLNAVEEYSPEVDQIVSQLINILETEGHSLFPALVSFMIRICPTQDRKSKIYNSVLAYIKILKHSPGSYSI